MNIICDEPYFIDNNNELFCPVNCPFISSNDVWKCIGICTSKEKCSLYNSSLTFADEETNKCVPCLVSGCIRCIKSTLRKGSKSFLSISDNLPNICLECIKGYRLSRDRTRCSLIYEEFITRSCGFLVVIFLLSFIFLSIYFYKNRDKINILLFKLAYQYRTLSKFRNNLIYGRPLYPLNMKLSKNDIGGIGLMLYFRYLTFLNCLSILFIIVSLFDVYLPFDELIQTYRNVESTTSFEKCKNLKNYISHNISPLIHMKNLDWMSLDMFNMTIRFKHHMIFSSFVRYILCMIITFVFIYNQRKFYNIKKNTSYCMMDYALSIANFSSSLSIHDIQNFFENLIKKKIIGISSCYDFYQQKDLVFNLIEEQIEWADFKMKLYRNYEEWKKENKNKIVSIYAKPNKNINIINKKEILNDNTISTNLFYDKDINLYEGNDNYLIEKLQHLKKYELFPVCEIDIHTDDRNFVNTNQSNDSKKIIPKSTFTSMQTTHIDSMSTWDIYNKNKMNQENDSITFSEHFLNDHPLILNEELNEDINKNKYCQYDKYDDNYYNDMYYNDKYYNNYHNDNIYNKNGKDSTSYKNIILNEKKNNFHMEDYFFKDISNKIFDLCSKEYKNISNQKKNILNDYIRKSIFSYFKRKIDQDNRERNGYIPFCMCNNTEGLFLKRDLSKDMKVVRNIKCCNKAYVIFNTTKDLNLAYSLINKYIDKIEKKRIKKKNKTKEKKTKELNKRKYKFYSFLFSPILFVKSIFNDKKIYKNITNKLLSNSTNSSSNNILWNNNMNDNKIYNQINIKWENKKSNGRIQNNLFLFFQNNPFQVNKCDVEPIDITWQNISNNTFIIPIMIIKITISILVLFFLILLWSIIFYGPYAIYALHHASIIEKQKKQEILFNVLISLILGIFIGLGNFLLTFLTTLIGNFMKFDKKQSTDSFVFCVNSIFQLLNFLLNVLITHLTNAGGDNKIRSFFLFFPNHLFVHLKSKDIILGEEYSFGRSLNYNIIPFITLFPTLFSFFGIYILPFLYKSMLILFCSNTTIKKAEKLIQCPECNLHYRYSEAVISFTVTLLLFFFTHDKYNTSFTFLLLFLSYLFIKYRDTYLFLRETKITYYYNTFLFDTVIAFWSLPTGILAILPFYWMWRSHKTSILTVGAVFFVHIFIYFIICNAIRKNLNESISTNDVSYNEVAQMKAYNWFNTNPVYVLKQYSKKRGVEYATNYYDKNDKDIMEFKMKKDSTMKNDKSKKYNFLDSYRSIFFNQEIKPKETETHDTIIKMDDLENSKDIQNMSYNLLDTFNRKNNNDKNKDHFNEGELKKKEGNSKQISRNIKSSHDYNIYMQNNKKGNYSHDNTTNIPYIYKIKNEYLSDDFIIRNRKDNQNIFNTIKSDYGDNFVRIKRKNIKQSKKKRIRNKRSKITKPRQKDLIYYVIGKEYLQGDRFANYTKDYNELYDFIYRIYLSLSSTAYKIKMFPLLAKRKL
ncbi:putative protein, unknown function [Plasmodium gaboni]|uniref:Uncharacterized protein n=1 Tax=Plasmodium gaboni TaxID=647221 RepID=A0A151LNB2_9APIC|nr:putative protein, unknown function [Plasmodium gaboni]KYO00723.1 putative protein, unknown function [Plasmodium gaboni]